MRPKLLDVFPFRYFERGYHVNESFGKRTETQQNAHSDDLSSRVRTLEEFLKRRVRAR